jgi:hypothetical protein
MRIGLVPRGFWLRPAAIASVNGTNHEDDDVMFFGKCRYLSGLRKVPMNDSVYAYGRGHVIIDLLVAQVDR